MEPKRLTDKSFVYTPSFDTDISRRFKKVLAEQRRQKAKELAAKTTVLTIRPRFNWRGE